MKVVTKQTAVNLTPEVYEKLKDIAKEQDRSVSFLIRIAIEEKYVMDNGNEDKTASIDAKPDSEHKPSLSDMLANSDYS